MVIDNKIWDEKLQHDIAKQRKHQLIVRKN